MGCAWAFIFLVRTNAPASLYHEPSVRDIYTRTITPPPDFLLHALSDADEAPEDEPEIEDEIVTEQRRVDKEKHMEEMASIETEYAILKDKLFKQRLSRVEDSLRRLKDGRLSRYKHQQEAIQAERETRLTMANARRVFREHHRWLGVHLF